MEKIPNYSHLDLKDLESAWNTKLNPEPKLSPQATKVSPATLKPKPVRNSI